MHIIIWSWFSHWLLGSFIFTDVGCWGEGGSVDTSVCSPSLSPSLCLPLPPFFNVSFNVSVSPSLSHLPSFLLYPLPPPSFPSSGKKPLTGTFQNVHSNSGRMISIIMYSNWWGSNLHIKWLLDLQRLWAAFRAEALKFGWDRGAWNRVFDASYLLQCFSALLQKVTRTTSALWSYEERHSRALIFTFKLFFFSLILWNCGQNLYFQNVSASDIQAPFDFFLIWTPPISFFAGWCLIDSSRAARNSAVCFVGVGCVFTGHNSHTFFFLSPVLLLNVSHLSVWSSC